MAGMFAGRSGSIVATRAVIDHAGMIKVRRYPGIGGMADQAIFRSRNMVRIFTGGRRAVMTAGTGA